ncbi:kinase-like protein [Phanerochaete sordida]|uniref:Kinase-like protein n=1 Tax=Phanerochaete sordida TaxID=48140 RepID=A0A9P3GFR1_9APHY|nr:kinase-like protein [Phanerochaete sordida]
MPSSSSRQNSRFSTLKVFKFAGTQKQPPPPPPKDPYYQPNHSLASLSQTLPETFSPPFATHPSTPMSSSYSSSVRSASPSPSYTPSQYTASHAPTYDPTRTMLSPSQTSLAPDGSSSSKKPFFKFPSLGKRPKTPKSQYDDLPPEPDPSISMPWNFQHNLHVDEAFTGLPPTWSASLAEMGFTAEEIVAIQTRRQQSRPTLQSLPSESSTSPPSSSYIPSPRPHPRSSSLHHRDPDTLSQRSESSYAADVSGNATMTTEDSVLSVSAVGPSAYVTNRAMLTRSPDAMSQSTRHTTPSPPPQAGPSRVVPPSKDAPPRTPTKRTYHVANDSIGSLSSPPPAYSSAKKESALDEVDDSLVLPPALPPVLPPPTLEAPHGNGLYHDEEEFDTPASLPATAPRRFSMRPPRLSIHQDTLGDLSGWTESLFSIIPSTPTKTTADITPQASPSQRRSPSPFRANDAGPSVSSSRLTPSSSVGSSSSLQARQSPPHKPEPIHLRATRPTLPASPRPTLPASPRPPPIPPPSSSPLWQEVYDMVRAPESTSSLPSSSASPLFPPNTPATTTSPATSVETAPEADELQVNFSRDKENRDSNMSTMTVTPATIVRHVSVAKRARANMVRSPPRPAHSPSANSSISSTLDLTAADDDDRTSSRSESPATTSSASSDASSGCIAITKDDATTPPSTDNLKGKSPAKQASSVPYIETSPQPSPRVGEFNDKSIISPAAVREFREQEENISEPTTRPSIVVEQFPPSDTDGSPPSSATASPSPSPSPMTPSARYAGWIADVLAPLKSFIDSRSEPRELFADLQEIAEGESGSVFATRVVTPGPNDAPYVAVKQVALVPEGSSKLEDLRKELGLMKKVHHEHILAMDALYVDVADDALWIRMELMNRSLADILPLAEHGVELSEALIAQFAADALAALVHLNKLGIAHRDVRSDNLLVNADGVVKLADFSSAVQVPKAAPVRFDQAGVIYWQAPEMRIGPYNVLKVDVWSLGATVWELAQAEPPFSDATDASQLGDRWPTLDHHDNYSRSFHSFLKLCSEPVTSRPNPDVLLNTPFIRSAKGRDAVTELLARCRAVEEQLMQS